MNRGRPEEASAQEGNVYTVWYNLVTCAGDEAFFVQTPGFGRWQMWIADLKAGFAAAALIHTHNQTYHTGAGSKDRCNPTYACTSTR